MPIIAKMPVIKHTIQGIEFKFPYNKLAVNAVKKLPSNLRRWDNAKRVWIVSPSEIDELIRICRFIIGTEPNVIGSQQNNTGHQTRLLKVKYIGSNFSCGFDDKWNIVFSEDVLKSWFENGDNVEKKPPVLGGSKYSLLNIPKNASGSEIKKAYRKMAIRYHPDLCKDDDANNMFIQIKTAYDILKNPINRQRYDASLLFESDANMQTVLAANHLSFVSKMVGYRPPQRCGWIMATGKYEVGRFVVENILKWESIVENGMELVTSWETKQKKIVENWV